MAFSRWGGLDFSQFDAFLDDITDLALDELQHARERRAQGLLHLHHLEGQDGVALLQRRPLLRQQGDDGAGQRRHATLLPELVLVLAPERIDPMQIEPAVAGADVKLMAFDDGDDARSYA